MITNSTGYCLPTCNSFPDVANSNCSCGNNICHKGEICGDHCYVPPSCLPLPAESEEGGCMCDTRVERVCGPHRICGKMSGWFNKVCLLPVPACPLMPNVAEGACFCNHSDSICISGEICNSTSNLCTLPKPCTASDFTALNLTATPEKNGLFLSGKMYSLSCIEFYFLFSEEVVWVWDWLLCTF